MRSSMLANYLSVKRLVQRAVDYCHNALSILYLIVEGRAKEADGRKYASHRASIGNEKGSNRFISLQSMDYITRYNLGSS